MVTGTIVRLPTRTIRPLIFGCVSVIQLLSSASVGRSGGVIAMASAMTVPFVEGVQARTSPTSESFTGDTMNPENRSFSHPGRPKSQGSRWPLVKPHSVICLTAHSAAALWFGEPVKRGP